MNRRVNFTKRVQTAEGPRCCPVVLSANERLKPDIVFVDGKEERTPRGPIISSGAMAIRGSDCPLEKTLRKRQSNTNARKPN